MVATSARADYYLDMFVSLRIITFDMYHNVAHVAVVKITYGTFLIKSLFSEHI